MKTTATLELLNCHEMQAIFGGRAGDAAYWIGRTYIWSTAHVLTFGLSTIFLIANNID